MVVRRTLELVALEKRHKALQESINDQLLRLEALRGESRGIDHAISILNGIEKPQDEPDGQMPLNIDIPLSKRQRQPRGAVKEVVLDLIMKHADSGLKASEVVDFAVQMGRDLDRTSVASLLSRLFREGTLSFDQQTRKYGPAPRSAPVLRTVG